jgi:hypothetical protein
MLGIYALCTVPPFSFIFQKSSVLYSDFEFPIE